MLNRGERLYMPVGERSWMSGRDVKISHQAALDLRDWKFVEWAAAAEWPMSHRITPVYRITPAGREALEEQALRRYQEHIDA